MKLFLLQIALVTFKNTVKFQKSGNGISRPNWTCLPKIRRLII